MKAFLAGLLLALALGLAGPATAVEPNEMLADPAMEARARDISKGLRCVVCQNQSIDDSDADLARDLRVLVRERLSAGDSDDEVVAYVVSRYGDFVLLEPPFRASTLALWLGPALILVVGGIAVAMFLRRRTAAPEAQPAPLSADEEARLRRLLEDEPK